MNSQECINCRNKKPVNRTDNRLVTESCGHVKCMECLLLEKSGCAACYREKNSPGLVVDLDNSNSTEKTDKLQNVKNLSNGLGKDTEIVVYEDSSKSKKLETSHIKIETDANGKHYVCTVCKKKFRTRSQVTYHAYCNGQRKPYQCIPCNKSFATQSHYKYHLHWHRNERMYTCDICDASFIQMSKLQRHKLKHTQEKRFVCSLCNKGFNNLTALRKHGLTHTEERPYECKICMRRFRDGSNYRKHVDKHNESKKSGCTNGGRSTARRAHQCPRCPQAFHSKKDMRRHAAVHTDSKPFRCKICDRRFRRKDNLERHIRNTHPEYVPSSAVDCDELALKQLSTGNGTSEKTQLEILNPLPPLPQEVIQKHMTDAVPETPRSESPSEDKSYIIVANHSRESVIVDNTAAERPPSPECAYVHKIRKANCIKLPPIDASKMAELEVKTSLNKLAIGAPAKHKKLIYERILYGDGERRDEPGPPQLHWRKMKLNTN